MRWILFALALFPFCLKADPAPEAIEAPQLIFKPFTGKIARNKVRLRLEPNLDGKILREFNKGDLIVVTADSGDFYKVKAPEDLKGFVFRTFILDNVVEGNHVNIRAEPDLEAAVIGQLNKGTQINGIISPLNSKWLEIALPEDVQFYISKDYVENIGDATLLSKMRQRLVEVNTLLSEAQGTAQDEMQKPFVQINLDPVYTGLNKVIQHYSDFPEQAAKAKDLLTQIQDSYLQKKIAYLEAKAKTADQPAPSQSESQPAASANPAISPKMAAWIPVEALLYEAWAKQNGNASIEEFYKSQRQEAQILTGTIQPYIRSLRNKPGDYVLISKISHLPSAYLYSTQVDLQDKVGQEVTLVATPRPNSNFAFPAYFVLALE